MKTKNKKIALIVLFFVIVAVLVSWNRLFPQKQTVVTVDPATLPGIQTGVAPWGPELGNLLGRLRVIQIPPLAAEGAVLHIHQHLDLSINGATTTIASQIGINTPARFITPIHTHDTSGIIHVESNTVRTYTLGEFFDVWGV